MGAESIIPIMMSQNRRIIEQIKENKIKEAQKMKKVIYGKNWDLVYIADQGEYKGVKYFIVAGGIHPCAYVMCDEDFVEKHKTEWGDLDCIDVHGGVTWCEDVSKLRKHPEGYEGMCFGWDYGHVGDWEGYLEDDENIKFGHRKYMTDMLISDCENTIDQYLKILEDDKRPSDNTITKEFLQKNGFKSIFGDVDDSAWQISGDVAGKKWKIYIDLRTANSSYAINQSPRRKYEGEITTKDDLKSIIQLFNIPIEIV